MDGRGFRVVILGGGVAAIEGALALRDLAADRVSSTIVSPASEFVYRPLAVVRPFQARPSYRLRLGRIAEDLDASLVQDAAVGVDADRREARLASGGRLEYDALLIAIGARAEAVVGGGTFTPWDWGEGHAFRAMLRQLADTGTRRVVFIVPTGLTWPLPLYEIALLTDSHVRANGISGVSLTIVTAERTALEDFGERASAAVAALLDERGIDLLTSHETRVVEAGVVRTSLGPIPADVTVALPVIQPEPFHGVPANDAGFIAVDDLSRVIDTADVFAAGDCTNLPLKHGGIAAQQADVAATGIAELAGAPVTPAPLRPRVEGVLLTGATPLHLDESGARPISEGEETSDREKREKVFGRYLTTYLAKATPPLPPFAG
jgi:sulfide:quinone oxidoreductase